MKTKFKIEDVAVMEIYDIPHMWEQLCRGCRYNNPKNAKSKRRCGNCKLRMAPPTRFRKGNGVFGKKLGEFCNRDGCHGIIERDYDLSKCTCYIAKPCSYCVGRKCRCPVCRWSSEVADAND